jgi:hypothetical protein
MCIIAKGRKNDPKNEIAILCTDCSVLLPNTSTAKKIKSIKTAKTTAIFISALQYCKAIKNAEDKTNDNITWGLYLEQIFKYSCTQKKDTINISM